MSCPDQDCACRAPSTPASTPGCAGAAQPRAVSAGAAQHRRAGLGCGRAGQHHHRPQAAGAPAVTLLGATSAVLLASCLADCPCHSRSRRGVCRWSSLWRQTVPSASRPSPSPSTACQTGASGYAACRSSASSCTRCLLLRCTASPGLTRCPAAGADAGPDHAQRAAAAAPGELGR